MTRGTTDPRIDALIAEMDPAMAKIARELRRTIHAEAPELHESVKWHAPVWSGEGMVLCFQVYSDHLNLGLWRGAELADRFPQIEGTGKSLRHIQVPDLAAAKSPHIPRIIRAATALDAQRA